MMETSHALHLRSVPTWEARGGWGECGEITASLFGADNAAAGMNTHTLH